MPFLTQGKTNWKYILIVLILAVIVGGGILGYLYWRVPPPLPSCQACKARFISWCTTCRAAGWPSGVEPYSPDIHGCMKECFDIDFPKTVSCNWAHKICKDFGISELVEDIYKKSICYCNTASDCYKNLGVESEDQYWECSENKCVYQCKETAPLVPPEPGVEVEPPLCVLRGISIGQSPSLKGGKIENSSVLLEWSSVPEESTMEFNVYKKIASAEDVNNLSNKTLAPDFWKIQKPENLYDVIENENVTSYIDKKLENEKTYLYAITGTDRFCHEGNFFEFFVVSFPNEIKIWKMGRGGVLVWKYGQDWKTYQSSKMGFSIKCPPDLKVSLDIPVLDVISRSGLFTSTFIRGIPFKEELIRVEIDSWTELPEAIWGKGFTFQDWIDKEIADYKSRWDPQLKREDFILDNNPAVKISYIRFPILNSPYKEMVIRIYTQKERMYRISTWFDFEEQNIYLPIFNQMLSTFRFLE